MSNDGVISIVGNQNTTVNDGNNSLIIAGNGNDTLTAGANSVVVAGNGSDKVTVGANSAIVVGNGNDTLTAGAKSLIIAGNGNDTIYLGANDLVAVGNGKDTFVIPSSGQVALSTPTSVAVNEDGTVALAIGASTSGFGFGNEAIFGFNTRKDAIQLNTSQFSNFAAVMASAKQVGGDTVITGDSTDTILLDDVRLSSLTASDFTFSSNISVKISGIPAGVTLSDTAGAIAVTNGSATLSQAQLAGLTLKAGGVTSAVLTVTATDAATGNSVSKTIALSVNPVAPTLATPASLTVNAGGTIALGITETPYDPRDIVSLTIKGVPTDATLSAGTKNIDGSWTLTPTELSGLYLKAGNSTVTTLMVTATNTLGQSASTEKDIQLNVVTPLTITFDTVSFADTGIQGDHITNNGSVTLSGTVTDNLTVSQVQVFNGSTLLGPANVDNVHHTWSLTKTLADGTYNQLVVTATDTAGSTATAGTTQYVQIDTTPPTVTSQSESVSGLTRQTADIITVNASDTIGVASVAIVDDATGKTLGNATLSSPGTWTYNAAGLTDGPHQFHAVVTDIAGNQTKTTDLATVTVDTTAPSAVAAVTALSADTGSSATDFVTDVASQTVGGTYTRTLDSDEKIQVSTNGTIWIDASASSGIWSASGVTLTNGTGTILVRTVDTAGNVAAGTGHSYTLDTTAPSAVAAVTALSADTGSSATDFLTDVASQTVSGTYAGTLDLDEKFQVSTNGTTWIDASASSGIWSASGVTLASGTGTIQVRTVDTAGNIAAGTGHSYTLDTTAPTASISAKIAGPTNLTSDAITVNAADADGVASVVIDDNGNFLANAMQTAPGVWSYTANGLVQGGHDFTAVVTDNAGNSATTGHASLLVDTTAPAVTFDAVSYDHTGAANFTKDASVTLSGTASDNVTVAQVQVFSGNTSLGSAIVDNTSHTWTLTENLPQGVYTNLSAVATDEAGNTSTANNASVTQILQIDATAPSVTFNAVSFVDTGIQNDSITGNNLVTFSGSASDDVTVAQVQVFNGTQLLGNAVVDNSSHTWTLTTNLADGKYGSLNATATDEAGNTTNAGNISSTQSLQIDTSAPTITFNNVSLTNPADASGTVSHDGEVTLSGTVADDVSVSQVQVFNGAQLLGPATVVNGTWTLATTLAQGSYNQFHATATDEAGNMADAATQHVVTVSLESGYVADGYIAGATVFADANHDGKLDPGDASGITDASGHFVLGPGSTSGPLVLTGGTDTATGLAFTGVLTAPSGSTQVTPLTTLVQSVTAANGGNVTSASQAVATALGINPAVNLTDLDTVAAAYAGNSQAFVAASKVLNTVSLVASAVAGTGAAAFSSAASGAFSALAAQIVSSGTLDLNNSSVISTVVGNTLTSVGSSSTALTSNQTTGITSVVTSVNQATDQAVASSTTTTADLLKNVSATSIVAQGSASAQLQQATSGTADLSTVVANNTGTNLTNSVGAAVSQVGSVAPAPPTVLGLAPTDASPNNANLVHYLLTFSDPVTGVNASDFSLATTGLVGATISSVAPVTGSNGTQYSIAVNAGAGDGALALSFTGTTVQDVALNPLKDRSTHTGPTYTIDQDTSQQSALSLTVTNTRANSAGSANFSFVVHGLDSDDTGTVTFTDGQNTVSVNVSGAQANYTANLGALSDGPITSTLSLHNDAAGNSFAPVAGTSAVALSGFNIVNGVRSNGGTIQVVQNGSGDITINSSGSVVGQAGNGVIAEQSASGTGNIVVSTTGSLTGTGTGSIGLLAENLNAANGGNITVTATGGASGAFDGIDVITQGNGNIAIESAGAAASTVQFGIRAEDYGTGSISVVTDAGSTINSGGAGISLVSFGTSIAASANSTITVTANGTVNSGTTLNPSGSQPQGIVAGYYGANGTIVGTAGVANTNVNGTVVINNNANITAAAGYGIDAFNWGNGNVTVNDGAGTSVSGAQYGIGAYGLSQGTGNVAVNVAANATISSGSIYGILAQNLDVGNVNVTTSAGDVITSGSSGIVANNRETSIATSANSTITVTASGTINSGTLNNLSGSAPGGILAGYNGVGGLGSVANTNVNGTVVVNNNANITAAAGYGIDAYNWGNGDVTVNDGAGTSVSGAQYGIGAFGLSKGTGNIAVNVAANATISGGSVFGIQAQNLDVGNVSVTTSAGDSIMSGSSGINAQSQATSVTASSSVTVIANGTIHSGSLLTPNGSTPAGIAAGYLPGGLNQTNNNVAGNVLVQSNATIVTAAGAGINAYNYGTGNVTVTTGVSSSITAPASGAQANGIQANALNGGNVSVTNAGSSTGGTGLFAGANKAGNITIENDGQITATGFSGINVTQNSTGSTGSTTITNTGTVVGAANHSAINVNENSAGTVTINNSGTIGPSAVSSSSPAIAENGGSVVINNNGQINGSILTTNTGTFTGTLNNNAGATWQSSFIDDEGTITASGVGSAITLVGNSTGLAVGNSGTGSLTIAADAMLTADFLNIGNLAGSHGTVNVTGPGTTVNTTSGQFQNIGVGFDGTASLTIADHAVVTTTNMDVAFHNDAGVTDTLDVNNATLNVGQGLTIGDAGTAHATVENGGAITTNFLTLANQAGSTGSLTVDGAGSVVSTAGLTLGSSVSSATLSVTNGGAVDIGTGTSTIAGAVHVGSSAALQGDGVINGNLVNDGNLTVTGATLDVTGSVTGSGTFTINSGAHLEFGSSVAASDNVVFQSLTGSLILDHSSGFAGLISGFGGDGTLSGSDQIDLKDINLNSGSFSQTFDAVHDTLLVSDGTNSTTLHLVGTYVAQNFSFASDGGNGTIVYDPPVSPSTHGGTGNADGFKFASSGHVDPTEFHPEDLPHLGNQPSASWPASPGQAHHEGLESGVASHEAHDPMIPTGIANTELNSAHFHLV